MTKLERKQLYERAYKELSCKHKKYYRSLYDIIYALRCYMPIAPMSKLPEIKKYDYEMTYGEMRRTLKMVIRNWC